MLPRLSPETSAVASILTGDGLDLIPVVTDHDVVVFVQRVVVLVRERLGVVLNQALIAIDVQEAFAHFRTFGRASLGDGKRRQLHGVIGVGYANGGRDVAG